MKSRIKTSRVSSGRNPQVIGNKWKPIFLWQLRAEKI
jgi:hypothetical protein